MDAPDQGQGNSGPDPAELRHPMETRATRVIVVLDVIVVLTALGVLFWGTELLERLPVAGQYAGEAKFLLAAVIGAPVMATYVRRRRRKLALEESLVVSETQMPEIHNLLVEHCKRVGIPVPELYLSEAIDQTTTFTWGQHTCIILCTHDLLANPDSIDDILDFTLAREVGSICLGYVSLRNEMLSSFVARIPLLRWPVNHIRAFSRDRYGAFLAPSALRALMSEATGERLRARVNPDAYFTQLERTPRPGFWTFLYSLFRPKLPLTFRVRELRRAGLLAGSKGGRLLAPTLNRKADLSQKV